MSEGKTTRQPSALIAAAHELKTPLTIIAHLAAAMQDDSIDFSHLERQVTLQRIRLSADRTLRLVQGLTTSYRLENDDQLGFSFVQEPLNLTQLCEEVAHEITPYATAYEQKVELYLGARHQIIVGNGDLVRSILFNLADNAIRHNPPETNIRMALRRRSEAVRVCVQDNGPGFKKTDLSQLKKRLGQHVQPFHGRPGSSGLGIYIAGQMAMAMGARLGVGARKTGADLHVDFLYSKQLSFL